jgi:hypothetical protein
MSWSIDFAPLIDARLILALAVAAALVSLLGLVQRTPGAWLRAGAVALFVLALTDPSLKREEREMLPGVVAVVVDNSPSQALGDRRAQTEAARSEVEARLARMRGLEPRWIEAGAGDSDGTELFSALERGLADLPSDRIAGAILITDGQVHDVPGRVEQLGFDAPVHALLTGEEGEFDRRLVVHNAPRFGIVGEEQPITFRVEDVGGDPARARNPAEDRVEVTIRRDGDIVRTLRVTRGDNVTVPLEIPRGGRNIIEIEAEEDGRELTTVNNRAVITVEGIRENLRVLLCPASRMRASGPGAISSSPTPRSISSISRFCARPRSRTARRSRSCR